MWLRMIGIFTIAVVLGLLVHFFPGVITLHFGSYLIQMQWIVAVIAVVALVFVIWLLFYLVKLPIAWIDSLRLFKQRRQIRDKNKLIENYVHHKQDIDFKRYLNSQDHGIQVMMWSQLNGRELSESLSYAKPPYCESYYFYQIKVAEHNKDELKASKYIGYGLEKYPDSHVLNDCKLHTLDSHDGLSYIKKVGVKSFSPQSIQRFAVQALDQTTHIMALESIYDHLPKLCKQDQVIQWTYMLKLLSLGETKKAQKLANKKLSWQVNEVEMWLKQVENSTVLDDFYKRFFDQLELSSCLVVYKYAFQYDAKFLNEIVSQLALKKDTFTTQQHIDWLAIEVKRLDRLRQFDDARKLRQQLEQCVFDQVGENA